MGTIYAVVLTNGTKVYEYEPFVKCDHEYGKEIMAETEFDENSVFIREKIVSETVKDAMQH